MLYVPLDFEINRTVDALVASRPYVNAIAQNKLNTIKQKAPSDFPKIDDRPNFQIQVSSGQLGKLLATTTLKFEIAHNTFAEHFVVMKKITEPIIGLHFVRNNSVVIDTPHGLIQFPHLTTKVRIGSSETTVNPQPVLTNDALTIPPRTTKTITASVRHSSESNTLGTVTLLKNFTETANLLISHSMLTIIDKIVAVRVTNTTELLYLIRKNTQVADFSVITPEQSKYIKPVDMVIRSMIPQSDPDLLKCFSRSE